MRCLLLLLLAAPAFADGTVWIVVRPVQTVRVESVPVVRSSWIVEERRYVEPLRWATPAPTTFAASQTVTQVPQVYYVAPPRSAQPFFRQQYGITQGTHARRVEDNSTLSPVITATGRTTIGARGAVLRGGTSGCATV